jgi:hypothetical protein
VSQPLTATLDVVPLALSRYPKHGNWKLVPESTARGLRKQSPKYPWKRTTLVAAVVYVPVIDVNLGERPVEVMFLSREAAQAWVDENYPESRHRFVIEERLIADTIHDTAEPADANEEEKENSDPCPPTSANSPT